jgi:hypothetical protein
MGGESRIVSLVLPDTAETVKAGSMENGTFQNFTSLAGVTGANITAVDSYAFYKCTSLKTVNLPEAVTIGISAFNFCASLTTVDFPEAVTIGSNAFAESTSLTTVNLPKAETINTYAFQSCESLTEVKLPAATSIGQGAFSYCTAALTTVRLGETVPNLGSSMVSGITSATIYVKVPSTPAATEAWSGIIGTYDSTDTTANNWGNGFRGSGWENGTMPGGLINQTITLIVEYED